MKFLMQWFVSPFGGCEILPFFFFLFLDTDFKLHITNYSIKVSFQSMPWLRIIFRIIYDSWKFISTFRKMSSKDLFLITVSFKFYYKIRILFNFKTH